MEAPRFSSGRRRRGRSRPRFRASSRILSPERSDERSHGWRSAPASPGRFAPRGCVRFARPAGEYDLQTIRNDISAESLALQLGRAGPPLERWDVTGSIWEHRFALPIDAEFVGFRASPNLSSGGGELRIAPVRIVDQG